MEGVVVVTIGFETNVALKTLLMWPAMQTSPLYLYSERYPFRFLLFSAAPTTVDSSTRVNMQGTLP